MKNLAISDKQSCIDTMYFKYQTRATNQIKEYHEPVKFETLHLNLDSSLANINSFGYEKVFYQGMHNLFQGNYLQSTKQFESIINNESFIESDFYYPAMFYLFVLYIELDELKQAEYTVGLLLQYDEVYIKEKTEKLLKEYSLLVYLKLKILS